MNRRHFLGGGVACGALAIGGFLFVRRNQARADTANRMLDDALPALTKGSLKELQTLPALARDDIKRYFHGKCLNAEGFVTHIYSDEFAERLGRCRTQDEREACFLQAFCACVATDSEILNQVETIAADVGGELDSDWASYCAAVSAKWNTGIPNHANPLASDELLGRLDDMIRSKLAQAAHEAVSAYQRPAVGETIGKIGQSACSLPLSNVTASVTASLSAAGASLGASLRFNPMVVPAFFILAARPVWEYIRGRLSDRHEEQQAAISGGLALLGNHVGAEFEREVRQRLADLHTWRERSLRATATRLAEAAHRPHLTFEGEVA